MTNMTNPITASNLEHLDRVIDAEGNTHTIARAQMIDHERVRISTLEGMVRVASNDELFDLITDDADDINDSQI